MYKEFNRGNLGAIQEKMVEKLKEIENELGIKFESQGCSFGDIEATFKIKGIIAGTDPGKDKFEKYCNLYGLEKSDFGKTFSERGKEYKITGILTSSRKYPIEVVRLSDGQKMKYTVSGVKTALGK